MLLPAQASQRLGGKNDFFGNRAPRLVGHDASGIGIPPSPTEQEVLLRLQVVESVTAVPLLGGWGLAGLFLFLAVAGLLGLRRL